MKNFLHQQKLNQTIFHPLIEHNHFVTIKNAISFTNKTNFDAEKIKSINCAFVFKEKKKYSYTMNILRLKLTFKECYNI